MLVCGLGACSRLLGQSCTNIAGTWDMTEHATLACSVRVAGETDNYSDPLSADRSVIVSQDSGSCAFRYDPGTIGAGPFQYLRTEVMGSVAGNALSTSGGALRAQAGTTLMESSFHATGAVSGNHMTLSGSGVFRATGPADDGLTATLNCTFTSMAEFTRQGPPAPSSPPAVRSSEPALQAFQGGAGLSAGTWVEIYGENLAAETRDWSGLIVNGQAPTSIDNIGVNFGNQPAFLYYVSPGQINVQVPDGTGLGPVSMEVVTPAGRSSRTVQISEVSPALLTTPAFHVGDRQYVAALFSGDLNEGRQVFVGRPGLIQGAEFRPARPGDRITIFAVGCGPTDPPSPAGQVVEGLHPLANPAAVSFGPLPAATEGFLSPGAIGLCQLNVTVPNVTGVANGDIPIAASIRGVDNGQDLYITMEH